jgi:uncharacterized membrane protein YkvA (DUF1232 family)
MKGQQQLGPRIVRDALFTQLKNTAGNYLRNPDRLLELIRKGRRKAASIGKDGPLGEVWDSLMAFLRLLRAYARKEYTNISWQHLVLIVAAVLYFLAPIDVIPDWIIGLGFLDDAAVVAWVIKAVKRDLDDFRKWESSRAQTVGNGT